MRLAVCNPDVLGALQETSSRVQEAGAYWTQFGDQLLLYAAKTKWKKLQHEATERGLILREYPREPNKNELYLVVQKGNRFEAEYPEIPVILHKGRYLAVELSPKQAVQLSQRSESCFSVRPLPVNSVVFDQAKPSSQRTAVDPWVHSLTEQVSIPQFQKDLEHLVSFPTRFSTTSHFTDVVAWCESKLKSYGYKTRLETISVGNEQSYNVIAEKLGKGAQPRDVFLAVAHADSITDHNNSNAPAPGADDNASGTAGVIEIARIFQKVDTYHDLRLVIFGGEEQGLLGSRHYIETLTNAEKGRIRAALNMDMIGTKNLSTLTVLLEGKALSQDMLDSLARAASTYTSLSYQRSLQAAQSDHVSFLEAGIPSVLTIEGADRSNQQIHTERDTLEHIDYNLMQEILKLNVAYLAHQLQSYQKLAPRMASFSPEPRATSTLGTQWSGRYIFNGGVSALAGRSFSELHYSPQSERHPMYALKEPIYLPADTRRDALRFTLHIDIDGYDPLQVVSGTIQAQATPIHFIGRVTSNTMAAGGMRSLIIADISFQWPGSQELIKSLELTLSPLSASVPISAEAHFIASSGRRFGPYGLAQQSIFFREVEVEVDREDQAAQVEPYDTHTHPNRPADLPRELLTLEDAFAKAGIQITRSPHSNVINTTDAANTQDFGPGWSIQELHDAMEQHWSAYANRPQWKMWLFLAELGETSDDGGIMFDGEIDEPGSVTRQGTALFTKSPLFHTTGGDYPKANPPVQEAIHRELFFNLIHEAGHAFNLAHSFQKELNTKPGDSSWPSPSWSPLHDAPSSLSWMNYPDRASSLHNAQPLNATWFYNRFRFRFDSKEHLFLRHAPENYVQMGNAAWFQNHGRVSRDTLDPHLRLLLRSRKEVLELGEPLFLELRLSNEGNTPVLVHNQFDPSNGFVEVALTDPQGHRTPILPLIHKRSCISTQLLQPKERIYHALNLTVGRFGFLLKEPGPYRIEASFTNVSGATVAAVKQLWVRPADFDDQRVLSTLYHAHIGRVLYFNGSHALEEANHKLDWISAHLPPQHPLQAHLAMVRTRPLAKAAKRLTASSSKLDIIEPNPDQVYQRLAPLLDHNRMDKAADTLGHITFRSVVDTFCSCADQVGKRVDASQAQNDLLQLFDKRRVVPEVLTAIAQRAKEFS